MTDTEKPNEAPEGPSTSKALLSGVLDSPYGGIRMMFNDRWWPNGTTVKDNKIAGETLDHYVPDHWIKADNDKAQLLRRSAATEQSTGATCYA